MSRLLGLALVLALAACEDERSPVLLDQAGDPCRSDLNLCETEDDALTCADQVWTPTSCDAVCAAIGPAYVSAGCDQLCECGLADPDGCVPGETVCLGDDTLEQCLPTQATELVSCSERCEAAGLESLGCQGAASELITDECWCSAEGTACDATLPICVDTSTLARCMDGIWEFESCDLACPGAGSCDPWAAPVECVCE